MPSRADSFGLVGLEAISLGTPALISARTGLGELLSELSPSGAASFTVPLLSDDHRDTHVWGDAIARILKDLPAAFASVEDVRHIMAKKRTWAMAANQLLQSIES
jgi:glycosyltransferase involved in cell wall biosynthesis